MNEFSATAQLEAPVAPGILERISGFVTGREFLVALLLFVAIVAGFTTLKVSEVRQWRGDSAIFFQVTENVARRGVGVSQVFANTQGYLDSHLMSATAQQIAANPLTPPAEKERDMLRFHAYYVLYLIAPLVWLLPANGVVLFLFVLSYVGVLFLAYLMLRRRNVPIAAALLCCLLFVSHPGWSQSLLEGQFFPDRLFVLAGFALMCIAYRRASSPLPLAATGVLCMLIGERAAITGGLFLIAYGLLYWRQQTRSQALVKIALGAVMLVYGEVLIKFVLADAQYSSFLPGSLGEAIALFHNPAFAHKAALYMLIALPFLALSLFDVRATAIALLLMLPNILGNIGGAEKIGWASHYHTYDLPGQLWAAMVGCIAAYRTLSGSAFRWAFYSGVAALILLINLIAPSAYDPISIGWANIPNTFFPTAWHETNSQLNGGGEWNAMVEQMLVTIPPGSVVSTVEEGMPLLYRDRTIRALPIGIDKADYAVMYFERAKDQPPQFLGVDSFLDADEKAAINQTIVGRMSRDGYDFAHARTFSVNGGLSGIAIVHRL